MAKGLTAKQEAFAKEYVLNGGNASEAYRKCYNATKMKVETIKNNAYKLLQNNDIATTVKELKAEVEEIAAEKFQIDAEWVLREQAYIYAVAKGEIPTKAMIKSRDDEGNELISTTQIEKHDLTAANKALENIGKHVNVQAWKEKQEITGEINIPAAIGVEIVNK